MIQLALQLHPERRASVLVCDIHPFPPSEFVPFGITQQYSRSARRIPAAKIGEASLFCRKLPCMAGPASGHTIRISQQPDKGEYIHEACEEKPVEIRPHRVPSRRGRTDIGLRYFHHGLDAGRFLEAARSGPPRKYETNHLYL